MAVSSGSIAVAVRVRPPNAWETARLPEPLPDTGMRGDGALSTPGRLATTSCVREVVRIIDDRILVFDPDEKDRARAFLDRGFVPPGTKRYKDKRFMFDRVFNGEARQLDVYEATAKPLLDRVLEGYNATVFAYGATGCGKTHTISGTEQDPGLIYLTMSDLFEKIEEKRSDHIIDIYVTFLEIYNEEIRDLLAEPGTPTNRGGLQIREDKTVKVVGLVELHPTSAEQIKDIVLLGNSRRTQSPTHANETSSRSHAVLQIHVTQSPRTASTTEEHTMATLSIIDLAGSERAAATSNMGQRMVEGANINKSLLALGNCINALCESGGATRHVPYRNSKLTRLLKFSLGGNCKTVMIVCIAPTSNHFDDTHNTLLYADRATKIKTKVVTRNVVNVDRHVGQYVEAINRLNIEVAELKGKLAGKLQSEADVIRKRRDEAKAEAARATIDIQRKIEQLQPSLRDGAEASCRLAIARSRIEAFNRRRSQLVHGRDAQQSSSDILAEGSLLETLAREEEKLLTLGSSLQSRVLRSANSESMFEAMLRAVTERRSDRLEEVDLYNIKLTVECKRAEMQFLKSEAQRQILLASIESQSDTIACLAGALTRCSCMLDDGSRALVDSSKADKDAMASTASTVSDSLHRLAAANDTLLSSLFGCTLDRSPSSSSLLSFTSYAIPSKPTNPPIQLNSQPLPTGRRSSRRISSLGSVTSPGRKVHKSPRKISRSSLVPKAVIHFAQRRAVSEHVEKKKVVQWRDEAGQGSLVDGDQTVSLAENELSLNGRLSSLGSESEWEDDEKTEDSVSCLFTSSVTQEQPEVKPGPKRSRPNRLDPSFLRSKGSTLGCLMEDDESKELEVKRRSSPLVDRINRMAIDEPQVNRPSRNHDSQILLKAPGSAVKSRRRSNIGPLRVERSRRRSSLLPQPLSENISKASSGARRVPIIQTPKRTKRASLLGGPRVITSLRTSVVKPMSLLYAPDPNASAELKSAKPTWR